MFKKYPNIIALAFFALSMILAIFLFPVPELSSHLSDTLGLIFTLFTESAGKPFFLITIALFCCIPIVMRLPRKTMVKLWIQFAIILVLSLVAKTALKHFTAVPRPFTHELQQLHVIEQPQDFYQLSKEDKALTVAKVDDQVSHWRTDLWKRKSHILSHQATLSLLQYALCFGVDSLFVAANMYLQQSSLLGQRV
ncbi:hypothetical protein Q8W13_11900 [Photobacterium damselae subsp. piscicida]|nr:hypothetical protein [Photobacterium damselae subsp. piscicida]